MMRRDAITGRGERAFIAIAEVCQRCSAGLYS